jgi:L-lactate dehydrogenase complex protein LldG
MAQAAIADTGTLVLESDCERHRLVSLVPPLHIAIVNAEDIRDTLGDTLRAVSRDAALDMSRVITFITGPSRTADIELTLTVGVHGPKELYVILIDGPRLNP